MLKSIMCTLDGSAYSESVLEHGIKLAVRFKAELRILSVIDIRMFEWVSAIALDGFVPAIPGPNYMKDSRHILEAKAKDTIEKAKQRAADNQVAFKADTEIGVPGDVICEESRFLWAEEENLPSGAASWLEPHLKLSAIQCQDHCWWWIKNSSHSNT